MEDGQRRQGERRSGQDRRSGRDRRSSERADPLPRRAQLRRQDDVLAYLQAQAEQDHSLAKLAWLDATPLRFDRSDR